MQKSLCYMVHSASDPGQGSWSKLGKDAEKEENTSEPTMVLGLIKGYDDYNQHIVIHEFGHALGLEHEHQRSLFWGQCKNTP